MERSNIIILTNLDTLDQEAWGSLTELCDNHERFKYSTIKAKKYPFEYKGFLFNKVKYRKKYLHDNGWVRPYVDKLISESFTNRTHKTTK